MTGPRPERVVAGVSGGGHSCPRPRNGRWPAAAATCINAVDERKRITIRTWTVRPVRTKQEEWK